MPYKLRITIAIFNKRSKTLKTNWLPMTGTVKSYDHLWDYLVNEKNICILSTDSWVPLKATLKSDAIDFEWGGYQCYGIKILVIEDKGLPKLTSVTNFL